MVSSLAPGVGKPPRSTRFEGERCRGEQVRELYRRSVKFQNALDTLVVSHASQLELLRSLAADSCDVVDVPETSELKIWSSPKGGLEALSGDKLEDFEMMPFEEDEESFFENDELGVRSAGGHKGQRVVSQLAIMPGQDQEDEYTLQCVTGGNSKTTGEIVYPSHASQVVEVHRFWATFTPSVRPARMRSSPSMVFATKQNTGSTGHNSGSWTFKSSKWMGGTDSNEEQITGSLRRDRHLIGRSCVVKPGSTRHLTHAIVSLFVIFYDIMSLPLTAAFQLDTDPVLYALDLGACVFWSLDVMMNFFTGYNTKDRVEMRMRKIARRYVRTWFVFDMLVICFDWITLLISDVRGLGLARTAKSPRIVRIFFRTLRLLRVIKLVMVFEDVVHLVVSDWLSGVVGITKMLLGMIIFNHFVACGWYAMGMEHSEGVGSWLHPLLEKDPSLFHRYIASFHWSMCQYTPAPNDFHPENFHERLYACITLLFGIAVFSAFLGKITSLLTHMSASAYARSRDERAMKQYLAANMVTLEVANRINMFLKNRQLVTKIMPYSEVRHFISLPKSLAMQLKYQAHMLALKCHPLLCHLRATEDGFPFIFKLCTRAVVEVGLKWGDELLHAGSPATQVIFAKHGKMDYMNQVAEERGDDGLHDASIDIYEVGPGLHNQWACEMALWCEWAYHGHLKAAGVAIALVLEVPAFHSLVAGYPPVFRTMKEYAEGYTTALLEALQDPNKSHLVDDIWGQENLARQLAEEALEVDIPRRDRRREVNMTLMSDPQKGFMRFLPYCLRRRRLSRGGGSGTRTW